MFGSQPRALLTVATTSLFLLTSGATLPVIAQESEGALEEVVVTARKREEALLEVPLAITALTSTDLEVKGMVEFKDIIDFTPGFFFAEHSVGRGDRSNRLLVVRGMRINTENDNQQAATVFVDGMPMLGSVIAGLEDAERIEVIRGPQSAYFGRSTFAGAVNFVTKTPGDEFTGKVIAEAGNYGTQNFGLQVEGPISDGVSYRLSGSQWQTDGHYKLGNDPTVNLGSRKTTSFAGTLYFQPNERFSAKLRIHNWRDIDGPSAAFGYGIGNGEEFFNCNPPGSTLLPINGANNFICGEAPFPTGRQIQGDFVLTPEKRDLLNGGPPSPGQNLDVAFSPAFLDGFGFERLADQASLVIDYTLDNGMTFSSGTAYHTNDWMALDDLDRRATAILPGETNDVTLLNSRKLEDFSQEFRLSSSPDSRLRWLIGLSYQEMEGVRTSGFKLFGLIRSGSFGNVFDIETTGIFGSVEYDFNDQFTLSVEGRQQDDDLTQGASAAGTPVSGSFSSFTPRVILDYKPNDDLTFYASYGEGTRPGNFNVNLLDASQFVLDQLAGLGFGSSVPEEELTNFEVGIKGTVLGGRAQIQAALYVGDWDAQSAAAVPIIDDNGNPSIITASTTGGNIDLFGIEFEGIWAATENFTLEGTFSINEAEFKTGTPGGCSDCGLLLGQSDVTGLGLSPRGSPETQGSLSGTYEGNVNAEWDWYARGDYIFTGSRYATQANLLETGDTQRVNLRAGIESENLRLELYGENVFEDETFTNYQFLLDFAYIPRRFITAGLPDKRTWGIRATYTF